MWVLQKHFSFLVYGLLHFTTASPPPSSWVWVSDSTWFRLKRSFNMYALIDCKQPAGRGLRFMNATGQDENEDEDAADDDEPQQRSSNSPPRTKDEL